jgi:hypothetical protein
MAAAATMTQKLSGMTTGVLFTFLQPAIEIKGLQKFTLLSHNGMMSRGAKVEFCFDSLESADSFNQKIGAIKRLDPVKIGKIVTVTDCAGNYSVLDSILRIFKVIYGNPAPVAQMTQETPGAVVKVDFTLDKAWVVLPDEQKAEEK